MKPVSFGYLSYGTKLTDMNHAYVERDEDSWNRCVCAIGGISFKQAVFWKGNSEREDLSTEEPDMFHHITDSGTYGNKGTIFQNLIEEMDNGMFNII